MRAKLKKFAAKDFLKKSAKLQESNLAEDKGEIKDNWMFNSQMMVNLHKSKINDHNKKRRWNSGLVLKFGKCKIAWD